jgi:hypothetical protein
MIQYIDSRMKGRLIVWRHERAGKIRETAKMATHHAGRVWDANDLEPSAGEVNGYYLNLCQIHEIFNN